MGRKNFSPPLSPEPTPITSNTTNKKVKKKRKNKKENSHNKWLNLPEPLLLSVLHHLSVPDLLSLSAVCFQWRSFVKSSSLSPPPLLLDHYSSPSSLCHHNAPSQRYLIPYFDPFFRDNPHGYQLVGHSNGHLVFVAKRQNHAVVSSVFTSDEFQSPKLPSGYSFGDIKFGFLYEAQTLFLFTYFSDFLFWDLGSDYDWLPMAREPVLKIQSGLVFQEKIYCLVDNKTKLLVFSFETGWAPTREEMDVGYDNTVEGWEYARNMVVCGSELFLVLFVQDVYPPASTMVRSRLYRMDFERRMWVEVGSIGDWCLFKDKSWSGYLACANPGRWGGRSNCVYVPQDDGFTKEIPLDGDEFDRSHLRCGGYKVWVYPSFLLKGSGQNGS